MSSTTNNHHSENTHTHPTGGGNYRSSRNFSSIMTETTQAMPRHKQLFSNFIHSRVVSAVSDLIGKSIARPNAIFFGAALSFLVTIGVYLLSKNFGYSLSGFESIGAFLLGWTMGNLFDLFSPFIQRKK